MFDDNISSTHADMFLQFLAFKYFQTYFCDFYYLLITFKMSGRGKERPKKIRAKPQTQSSRAGLIFPVARIGRYLKQGNYSRIISSVAPVYLAAVLEFLCVEVMEIAAHAAKDNVKSRITPRHIQLAVRDDEQLNQLFGNVTIPAGGAIPNIHPTLLPTKKKSHGKAKAGKIESQTF